MPDRDLPQLTSLHPGLARALADAGLVHATAVQAQALAPIRAGADVRVQAPTGSGKTVAYVLPLLEHFAAAPRRSGTGIARLVLVPTRELALQVRSVVTTLAAGLAARPKVVVAIGGASINPQLMALRGGADLVIATPGRLLDLHAHNAARLDNVAQLVLDEADRLLDEGFGAEVARVLALLPVRRQTLLFSATWPAALAELAELAAAGLGDPVDIAVAAQAQAAAPAIHERALQVDAGRRTALLLQLIASEGWSRLLVFVASRRGADQLAASLKQAGLAAHSLHGEHSNGTRVRVLREFEAGVLQVVVATDVAARGLDLARLPAVVNYDLPRAADDYVHRIGRSGRAGHPGCAVSFIDAASEAHFRLIEKRQGRRVPREQVPGFAPVAAPIAAGPKAADNGGIKGKRPSRKDRLRAAAAAQQPSG